MKFICFLHFLLSLFWTLLFRITAVKNEERFCTYSSYKRQLIHPDLVIFEYVQPSVSAMFILQFFHSFCNLYFVSTSICLFLKEIPMWIGLIELVCIKIGWPSQLEKC